MDSDKRNLQFFLDVEVDFDGLSRSDDELRLFLELLLEESDDDEELEEYLLRRSLCLDELLRSFLSRDRLSFNFERDFSRDFSRCLLDFSRSLSESDEYREYLVFLRCFSR